MKRDIVLAGVGGQGILLPSAILAASALSEGLHAKQSEVHGMAQRGGAVQAHLRLSDAPIHSELIPEGTADMILSMEPLESLRYLNCLSADGVLLTAIEPFDNIPDYPNIEALLGKIQSLPGSVTVDAARIARESGSALSANMVMLGAALRFVPLKPETIEEHIRRFFAPKGTKIVEANVRAFRSGMNHES